MIRFSLRKFPINKDLEDATGIPWGCSLEPLVQLPDECLVKESSTSLARCQNCFSYINPYTVVNKTHWQCVLCQTENEVEARYANVSGNPDAVPELQSTILEVDIPPEAEDNPPCQVPPILPVYIGVVDLTGGAPFLELVKDSLKAVIDGLSDDSMFGLVVFDDRIGMYNLYCDKPHVRYVRVFETGPCPIALQEMIQHEDAFVRIGDCREVIKSVLDTIPTVASAITQSRCFGSTVQGLVEFFSVYQGHTSFRARLLTFVSGPCNHGIETLTQRRLNVYKQGLFKNKDIFNEGVHKKVFQPQSWFYKDLAISATAKGVCIDLYVVSSQWVDLSSIRFLAEMTGGRLLHYDDVTKTNLPNDCQTLARSYGAGRGMLRLRTTSQFKVNKMRGPCSVDPYMDDVLHAAGLDVHQAFAAEFGFYRGSNKFDDATCPAIVQTTFAYTNKHGQRKLRIQTVKLSTVSYIENMFESADPEVIIKLYVYKSIDSCYRWGVNEGKVSVLDSYVYLLSHYNETLPYESQEFEIEFGIYPHLQIMSALIYGMFTSPFMSVRPDITLDQLITFQGMCIAANPEHLALLFYPHLMSFENTQQSPGLSLPLSPVTVKSIEHSYILLDAYHKIIIMKPQSIKPADEEIVEFSDISLEESQKCILPSDNPTELKLLNKDSSGTIEKYIAEAQCTRPIYVDVVHCSNPQPLCKYLINDSSVVQVCMPGSSYDHYYWRGYKAFYKFLISQLHRLYDLEGGDPDRLYDPEGESDYEEKEQQEQEQAYTQA